MCGAVHCSDIAILGIHRTPPKVQHECAGQAVRDSDPDCLVPDRRHSAVPGAAKEVEVIDEQCMYCGNCYTVCPAMQMNDPDNDGLSIWVGGKVSNARSAPTFSKLAVPFLPNNPPRWPEVVEAVVKIVDVYAASMPASTSGSASGSSVSAGRGSSS